MIDLHCHILPGLDDGPDTMDVSLQMAEGAIADGITHLVATPHCSDEYAFDYSKVRKLSEQLQREIGNRLEIATGCDFHLSPENVVALRFESEPYCINQKNYLLVEFNEFSIPQTIDHTLHDLRLRGIIPVITHPERNRILAAKPERLVEWIRLGCCLQITAGALTGSFGTRARETAWAWIEAGMVHIVASDAHDLKRRPVLLEAARALVAERFGKEKADALFLDNPRAAFEGQSLPYIFEIQTESPRKKRFFFF